MTDVTSHLARLAHACLLTTFGFVASAMGQTGPIDYRQEIAPILERHCWQCHGNDRQEGGLRLDRPARWHPNFRPTPRAKRVDISEVIERIRSSDPDVQMPPPPETRMSGEERELLQRWIDLGPPISDAALANGEDSDDSDSMHWSWQPLSEPRIPTLVKDDRAPEDDSPLDNPIDVFLAEERERHGLKASRPASRREWLRRLSVDLSGLLPTAEEVTRFEEDRSPTAYAMELDRLLAAPTYGERWAQHWLDLAHFADTHGFERDQKREHAWRYRDYVIRALDEDKPYDEFLAEQIAGDAIGPENPASIAATGFLAAGPWDFVGQVETPSLPIKRQARADDLDDMLTQIMTSTCGLTIHCARCHHHKVEPISQDEYYRMLALLSGVRRGDRDANPEQVQKIEQRRAELMQQRSILAEKLQALQAPHLRLSDIVGGGDGRGSGKRGSGIHVQTGQLQTEPLGVLADGPDRQFRRVDGPWIDGVVIPKGITQVSSSGLEVEFPSTSGQAWDAVRNGPVQSQKSTRIAEVDYSEEEHSLLGLHANAAITFDLTPFREALGQKDLRFQSTVGYGGRPEGAATAADFYVLLDGEFIVTYTRLGPSSGSIELSIPIPATARFLTVASTEGSDGIGHDQIFLGDPCVVGSSIASTPSEQAERKSLLEQRRAVEEELRQLPKPDQVYAVQSHPPEPIRVLHRGNPEQPRDVVAPGFVACVSVPMVDVPGPDSTDRERRRALASWITSRDNPLPSRVIVNRLWQHHFGTGLVATSSDFGIGGDTPSHPALLEWLACEMQRSGMSIKTMHRLICSSHAYGQDSRLEPIAFHNIDASNRYLWRQNPRRLDAEAYRDCVLQAAGTLQHSKFGEGYQDFEYQEEYAPIYRYRTADDSSLWRRSIYRFRVRTTPQPFLNALDCPDLANMTAKRNVTTTSVQALALWNNGFVLHQSMRMARELQARSNTFEARIRGAFLAVLAREPTSEEWEAVLARRPSTDSEEEVLLSELARTLFNCNEFIYID